MIVYQTTSIFESVAQVITNPVNCRGVMGAGLARQFRDKYPGIEAWHKAIVHSVGITPGDLYVYPSFEKQVLCFPTKNHWKQPSEIEYIEDGLNNLVQVTQLAREEPDDYSSFLFDSLAIPHLGCGLGGLDWDTQVHPLVKWYLSRTPFNVYIHG